MAAPKEIVHLIETFERTPIIAFALAAAGKDGIAMAVNRYR
jgi:hypothetical protein